jgi:hypothetical protein
VTTALVYSQVLASSTNQAECLVRTSNKEYKTRVRKSAGFCFLGKESKTWILNLIIAVLLQLRSY